MKIFFSYGHDDNAEFVEKIMHELKKEIHLTRFGSIKIISSPVMTGEDQSILA